MLDVAIGVMLPAACAHGQKETDVNGVPMKLYPQVYKEATPATVQAETNSQVMINSGPLKVMASPQGQFGPNGSIVPNEYIVIYLGSLASNQGSAAFGINNLGQIVGYSTPDTEADGYAFLYSNGLMKAIDLQHSIAYGINDKGQIIVNHFDPILNYNSGCYLYNPDGTLVNMGNLGGRYIEARGINKQGQVVGWGSLSGDFSLHTFLYSGNGPIQDLGEIEGQSSQGFAINDIGQVGGLYGNNIGYIYTAGSIQDIGLAGEAYAVYSINDSGQAVGRAGTEPYHAFLYDGSIIDISPPNSYFSQANAINNYGQAVGTYNANGTYITAPSAFLYSEGNTWDLNTLILANPGWQLESANAINDLGQIVGYGSTPNSPEEAFLLNPLPAGWKEAVETQPSAKTYGVPPTKTADGLVLITHGWTKISPDQSWINTMSNSITAYLTGAGITGWQVYGYYWEPNSSTPFSPAGAIVNATQEGISLGNSIVDQGWTKIHFIAHSAGAQLIQTATEIIKNRAPNTIVQCTFLDPFEGFDLAKIGVYGHGADWSDRYSSHGDIDVGIGIFTNQPLSWSYNVDVTALDPSLGNSGLFSGLLGYAVCSVSAATHGWAVQFYENSITGNITPDYDGFGFLLSQEAGGWPNAPTQYPVGNVNSVRALGNQPQSCSLLGAVTATVSNPLNFTVLPVAAQSTSGTVNRNGEILTLITGSPAWISIIPTNTEPVNLLSFDANFTSTGVGAAGLLTVLWDSGTVVTLDERTIGQGMNHYALRIPATESNSAHVLSFRLDPFTNVQSTIVITNVVLGQQGAVQPFSLSATTNIVNGLPVWQLTGQAGIDYGLQASTNLIDWEQIAVLENTNGTVNFSDLDSTNHPMRFYRAISSY